MDADTPIRVELGNWVVYEGRKDDFTDSETYERYRIKAIYYSFKDEVIVIEIELYLVPSIQNHLNTL